MKKAPQQLLEHLIALPYQKIITLLRQDNSGQQFDIDENGKVGYETGHKEFFLAVLANMLNDGGVLMIRQFTPLKTEIINHKNEPMWVPIKNVYALILGNNDWKGVPKDQLKQSYSIDSQTGQPLKREPDVTYKDVPEYFFENEKEAK